MDIKEKRRRDYERTLSLGITEATWTFVDVGKHSCEHRDLDGVRFDLRKGAPFMGKMIMPMGQCRCIYRSIIPGLDGEPPIAKPRAGVLARLWRLLRKTR